ncbi:MAG: RidA family protein [Firmicutes bacterium]|nr:RidA family protein [Bacillota bacterium]
MRTVSINSKGENKGHYSPGVICNGMLYISGQLSLDPDTRKAPEGGVEAHMLQALNNVDRVLKSAGLERSDVVQCRVYIDDINNWDAINGVYREFFGDHKPARVVVPVPALHFGCMVEIEAVADASKAR